MSEEVPNTELRLSINAGGDDQIILDLSLPQEALVEDILSELERVSVDEELPIWHRSSILAVTTALLEQRVPKIERKPAQGDLSVESVRAAAARFCQAVFHHFPY